MGWVIRFACLLLLALIAGERPARACGAFPSTAWVKAPPRLSLERTLIVWDSSTKVQHFVRELRFSHAAGSFGFVVPVPSRPKVHSVEASPFDALEKTYPSDLLDRLWLGFGSGLGHGAGLGAGKGAAPKPPPVQLVEQKRVGDFNAFILTATDPGALAAWLEKHGFKTSERGKTWVDHYVRLGFHFVALRFDGAKKEEEALEIRTLRISFESELPYYPYREPSDAPEQPNRELELWVVADVPLVPVAGVTHQDEWRLRRPFSEGTRTTPEVGQLEEVLGKELAGLLPRSRVVQTFGDYKPKRLGWEDVVFVPLSDCDDACRAAREKLVPFLDARLAVAPAPNAPAPAPSANMLSCALAEGANAGACWLLLPAVLLLARRRKAWLLAALLLGCERAPPPPPALPSAAPSAMPSAFAAPAPAFIAPREPGPRKQAVLDVLSNRFEGYLPVWSLPVEGGMGTRERDEDSAWTETLRLAKDCVGGLEAVVTLEADVDARGSAKSVSARGPLPKGTLACIEKHASETVFSPEGGERVERTYAYFGDRSAEAKRVSGAMARARSRYVPTRVRLRFVEVKVTGGLPEPVVLRLLRQRYGMFIKCHTDHVKGAKEARAKLRFQIDAEGKPSAVQTTSTSAAGLSACVDGILSKAMFPQPEKAPVAVSLGLAFMPD